MAIDEKDTKLVLELATYASKAIVQSATKDIFDRVNGLHESQLARIDAAIRLLSDVNTELSVTVQRVDTLASKVENAATLPSVEVVARRIVDQCADVHKKDGYARTGSRLSSRSVVIAWLAFGLATFGEAKDVISRLFS